jgi:hypothetical protein
MSLILFYRDCFTADTRSNKGISSEVDFYTKLKKTFISEDKLFAGMCCGAVLNEQQWYQIKNIFELFTKDPVKNNKECRHAIFETISSDWSSGHLYLLMGEYFYCLDYMGGTDPDMSTLEKMNYDEPMASGTGAPAARVLINSEKPFSQKQFFEIVSRCCYSVSREYTFIELKDVIGSHWYKKANNER